MLKNCRLHSVGRVRKSKCKMLTVKAVAKASIVFSCRCVHSTISAPHRYFSSGYRSVLLTELCCAASLKILESVLFCLEDCRIPDYTGLHRTHSSEHIALSCAKISDIYAKCKLLRMLKKRKHSIGIASPISNFQKGASNILKTCASARFAAVQ